MNKKILFAILFATATMFSVSAQKFKPSPQFLKGEKQINVIFDFDGVTIDKRQTEENFVKERMADQKTKEDAEEWKAKWYGEGRDGFKQIFIKYCNDELTNVVIGNYPNAEYTINVKIIDIDPGSFAGPFSNPAKLRAKFDIVKTNNNSSLAFIELKDIYNPAILSPLVMLRIEGGFGELGKELAKKINKELK